MTLVLFFALALMATKVYAALTLNATNITSNGSLTFTTPIGSLTLPSIMGTAGQFLQTNGSGVTTWATGVGATGPAGPAGADGAGAPGGLNQQIQFNNGGAFGGVPLLWNGTYLNTSLTGSWLQNTQTQSGNGTFSLFAGVASNLPDDARADDNYSIGWNVNNAIAGAGSAVLKFETHCHIATGCAAPGQSETYFEFFDGTNPGGVRALGFFQGQGSTPDLRVMARANSWTFFDAPQDNPLFIIRDSKQHTIYGTLEVQAPAGGDWLYQGGNSLIKFDSGAVRVAPGEDTPLVLGRPGAAPVTVSANNFQLANGGIQDTNSKLRLLLGAGADNYWKLGTSATGNPDGLLLQPDGIDTNVNVQLLAKGTGAIIFNAPRGQFGSYDGSLFPSAGQYFFSTCCTGPMQVVIRGGPGQGTTDLQQWWTNANATVARVKSDGRIESAVGYSVAGTSGVTASGTSCTITAITGGIITGATCAP